ncbi:MAG TPA: response regulator transcription factor [Bryobacteraceae bacterium]|nr:response regulator transcription factor [Bryobacteraceae bacterium]
MIRLLIVDSFPVVRAGLRTILSGSPDIQIVGEAQDGVEAVDRTLELLPDVILMELRLPNVDGLTVLRTLHTRAPQAKVLLFTASENKEDFIESMKLGCCGILPKDAGAALIAKSIQKVHAGEIWLDSNTTAAVIRQFASPLDPAIAQVAANAKPRERAQLSQREREIIVLIAQGYKNKEIAEKMFITEQTVKNHLHNVFDKLGVSDRLELALYAIHNSLHVKP